MCLAVNDVYKFEPMSTGAAMKGQEDETRGGADDVSGRSALTQHRGRSDTMLVCGAGENTPGQEASSAPRGAAVGDRSVEMLLIQQNSALVRENSALVRENEQLRGVVSSREDQIVYMREQASELANETPWARICCLVCQLFAEFVFLLQDAGLTWGRFSWKVLSIVFQLLFGLLCALGSKAERFYRSSARTWGGSRQSGASQSGFEDPYRKTV